MDPNKEEDTCNVSIVKKGSKYTVIGACRFKFLNISNYLASGVSYSAFLEAYKIPKVTSLFPYAWFDHARLQAGLSLLMKPSIWNWNKGISSRWETNKDDGEDNGNDITRTTKNLVHDNNKNYKTFGEIEAYSHFAISWSITTIWMSALSFKGWKKYKNSISINTSICLRWPSPNQDC